MEDWAEIRRLHRAEGVPIRAIARRLGVGRNTVRRALAAAGAPRYRRAVKGSIVDVVEPQIRALLADWPRMPATVIAERIGWDRSLTVLKERVRQLRPLYAPPDPVSRTTYLPGEVAQCDLWFPPVDVPLGFGQVGRPPVLVMVAGYSRVIAARMLPTRTGEDLLAGMWSLLAGWGGAPKTLVWDNESAIGAWKAGRPQLTAAAQAFRGTLGIASGCADRPIRRRRGWSSGPTAIWRPRSCPVGRSPRRRTSTASSAIGCRWRPAAGIAASKPGRPIVGRRIGPRWWHRRRCPRWWAGTD